MKFWKRGRVYVGQSSIEGGDEKTRIKKSRGICCWASGFSRVCSKVFVRCLAAGGGVYCDGRRDVILVIAFIIDGCAGGRRSYVNH